MEEYLREYRAQLVEGQQRVIDNYEKTLLTLSTGALALSITFVKDILAGKPACAAPWLLTAWGCWAMSVCLLLASYYLSPLAYQKALQQVDDGTITTETTGGGYTTAINLLNSLGGIAFFLGVLAFAVVGITNIGGQP